MVDDTVYEDFMNCSETLGHTPVQKSQEVKKQEKIETMVAGLSALVGK